MKQNVANLALTSSSRVEIGDGRWNQLVKWSGLGGIVGPILFVLSFIIAGFVRPDYSAVSQAVSDLGVGPMAWLVDIPIVILGLLVLVLAAGFFQATRPILTRAARWTCATLIALPGLGYIVAGIFTEAPSTLLVHWLVGATLGLYFPVVTLVIVGLALVQHSEWKWYGILSLVGAAIAVVVIVIMQQAFTPGSALFGYHIAGLAERVDLIVIPAWYAVMGWRLYRGAGVAANLED